MLQCREKGHFQNDCPQRFECGFCKELEHVGANCIQKAFCAVCQDQGHVLRDCPYKDLGGVGAFMDMEEILSSADSSDDVVPAVDTVVYVVRSLLLVTVHPLPPIPVTLLVLFFSKNAATETGPSCSVVLRINL